MDDMEYDRQDKINRLKRELRMKEQIEINHKCGLWYTFCTEKPSLEEVLDTVNFTEDFIPHIKTKKKQDDQDFIETAKFFNIKGPWSENWNKN